MFDDLERVTSDRSGRSENGDPFGQAAVMITSG
jgi:hypothetical protein